MSKRIDTPSVNLFDRRVISPSWGSPGAIVGPPFAPPGVGRTIRFSARRLRRACGYEVETADRGERALLRLRDWSRPVDWLYARVALPGLIDGWILADEYHDAHPDRAVVLSDTEARNSTRGDIILKQPTPTGVLEAIRSLIARGSRDDQAPSVSKEARRAA